MTYGIVSRVHVVSRIYYGTNTGNRQIGCFEITPGTDDVRINTSLIDNDNSMRDTVRSRGSADFTWTL